MKSKTLLLIAPLAFAMAYALPLFAQDANPTPNTPAPGGNPRIERQGEHDFGALSPEEREKLKAAHQKAMQDPKVQEAQKAFQEALKAAMLAADPTIGQLLEKMGGHGPGREPGGRHHHDGSETRSTPSTSASPTP